MPTFVNKEISEVRVDINTYVEALQTALYNQFKLAFCLVQSENFHGGAADAYKNYINSVAIYFINHLLHITGELAKTVEQLQTTFLNLEPNQNGIIKTELLESISDTVLVKNNAFEELATRIEAINTEARKYVSLVALSTSDVVGDFSETRSRLSDINARVADADQRAASTVADLSTLIAGVSAALSQAMEFCYNGSELDYSQINNVANQNWYNPANSDVLMDMWINDPFVYIAGQGAVWENQWAAGLDDDTYLYVGASLLSGSAYFTIEDNVLSMGATGSVLSAELGIETEYGSGRVAIGALSAEAQYRLGWSDDFKGLSVSGEASVVRLDGSFTVGNGIAEVSSTVKLLTADAFFNCEFTDRNNYSFGAGASADLVSVDVGVQLFEVPTTRGGTTPLLGANFSPDLGGVGAGFNISSVNVYDGGWLAVNAKTVYLDVELEIGGSIEVTYPSLTLFGFISIF